MPSTKLMLCHHDWVYGLDGKQNIRECEKCHRTEKC